MKTKKYFLAAILGIFVMLPSFTYSQDIYKDFSDIERKVNEAAKKMNSSSSSGNGGSNPNSSSGSSSSRGSNNSSRRSNTNSSSNSGSSSSSYSRDTYTPPAPPKVYPHNGVNYLTAAERDAAISKEQEKAKKEKFLREKPNNDAGFRAINSTKGNTSSGFKEINSTNNTSTGFREIGQSASMTTTTRPKVQSLIDVTTDARTWKTVDNIANLSGKNTLLIPVDKSTQKLKQVVTDAARQKAGYARGSAEDKAVTLATSKVTGLISGSIKQDISNKYLSGNKNSRLLITQTPGQLLNEWKENIANYFGIRSKAIDNAVWYGKNTPMTIKEHLDDILATVKGTISESEFNRRWQNRWSKYGQDGVKKALN